MDLKTEDIKKIYRLMQACRTFEEYVYETFKKGLIHGTTHLANGQEATAVGAVYALRDDDYIMSSHRGHAHSIAKGASLRRMMCELMGKAEGYCKGLGGSMHIVDMEAGNFGANGIIGPAIPLATGVALAIKKDKSDKVIVNFFGDGTSNSGMFHEALNMAALWKLPIIFFCENNLYGLSTHVEKSVSIGCIAPRAAAYGMPGITVDGMDVLAVMEVVEDAAKRARAGHGPTLIEAKTYRYMGHSKSDTCEYRTREEEAEWKKKDPLLLFKKYMLERGISESEIEEIYKSVRKECEDSADYAASCEEIDLAQAKSLVFG